jgi:hypothetical protein
MLDRLKKLEAAATPGPWKLEPDSSDGKDEFWGYWHQTGPLSCPGKDPNPDTELAAAARNSLPALIAVAEANKKLIKRVRELSELFPNTTPNGSLKAWHSLQAALFDAEDALAELEEQAK